jgi:hypothetical protein
VTLPALLVASSFFLSGLRAEAEKPNPTPLPREDPIVQLLDRDAIPAIRAPKFVSADKAKLADGEKVLGVVIGGEARAYTLIDLDAHEVVDDVVGGKPIAATW